MVGDLLNICRRVSSPGRAPPSFECSNARFDVEKLICGNYELAQLDVELAAAYQAALRAGAVEKDLQREWIKHNDECVRLDVDVRERCLIDRFKQRIADLRGTSVWPVRADMRLHARPHPSLAETREVCDFVASRGPSIEDELIEEGTLDANNDGREDSVSIGGLGGSMGGDRAVFRPKDAAADSAPIEIAQKGFEWNSYGSLGAGWLKRGKYVYTLNFDTEEHRHATYLGYIDPDNIEHVACDFGSIEQEDLHSNNLESGELCRQVSEGRIGYLDVTPATSEERKRDIGRFYTRLDGWVSADFRNIGQRDQLALLAFEGTAGRGCNFNYYEATQSGAPVASGDAHELLMALQEIDLDKFIPGPTCDRNLVRWFEYGGKTYFDNRSADPGAGVPFHEVKRLSGGEVARVCVGEFKVKWRVKTIWPHL